MCNTKSVLHDATPSWNGYNYQGKIGLYVCLENILEKSDNRLDWAKLNEFCAKHYIEYEWIEDFSIKENDQYLTLHQVKHKGNNKFKDHIEAIVTILNRKNGVMSHSDIFKYFNFSKLKKGRNKRIKKILLNRVRSNGLLNEDWTLNTNWKVNINKVSKKYQLEMFKCLSDFEALLGRAFNKSDVYFHTADDVDEPEIISSYSEIPAALIDGLSNQKSLSSENIYLSFDDQSRYELAMSDDELDERLEKQISLLLKLFHNGAEFSEKDVKLYKLSLCGLIDKNLILRHKHIRDNTGSQESYFNKTKPNICFSQIITVLENTFKVHDEEYWNLLCLEKFDEAYRSFLEELREGYEADVSEALLNDVPKDELEDICNAKLEEYRNWVDRLEQLRVNVIDNYLPSNFIGFLKRINPHKVMGDKLHIYYDSISDMNKIKDIFFEFILDITKPITNIPFKCNKMIFDIQPSCIDFVVPRKQRQLAIIDIAKKGLVDNYNENSKLFGSVDYISVNCNEEIYISTGLEKYTEVESYDGSQVDDTNKITGKKEMFFIDVKQALRKING
ncbi:TPA: hypothetical protein I7750_11985 [Vibrio vulnificus]|nr:hypothetical protein [Vibrio vulnificus]HAS8518326.1 hypothetical protein [Vibrio vulnificus]